MCLKNYVKALVLPWQKIMILKNITGLYKTIDFSKELDEKIIKKCLYKKSGDCVEYFDNAAKALGIIFMKFEDKDEMDSILSNINSMYTVVVEENMS